MVDYGGLHFSNAASVQPLNQPKMLFTEFSYIFITITAWDKCKMLLHFHHYPENNSLTFGYMGYYFYLEMAFLGLVFSASLTILPKMLWIPLRHIEKLSGKILDLFFSSVECFDKSVEMTLLDNAHRQSARYSRQNWRKTPVSESVLK